MLMGNGLAAPENAAPLRFAALPTKSSSAKNEWKVKTSDK
jgi:hypothetical protein